MLIFIAVLFVNACLAGTIPATPENITITFLTPTSVRVSWQTMIDLNSHPVEKYIVTYKPTDDRVVQDVAGNSEAVVLDRLSPSTQYSITVTAIWLGKKYRSRQVIFRTLDMPKNITQQEYPPGVYAAGNGGVNSAQGKTVNASVYGDDVTSTATNTLTHGATRELPTIRGVEIGIVLIVLMVWAGAIALFFNRWGKIRMLLPYQPDYKHEQLKVPGTGVCSAGGCNGQHSHQFDSSECGGTIAYPTLHCNSRHIHMLPEEHSASLSERCTRSRINSAIFVSSEGRGFDSIEFLRRHGSQSVLCRKAKSAENITDNSRKKSFAEKRHWRTDEDDTSAHNDIELKECGGNASELHTLSVLKANHEPKSLTTAVTSLLARSAAITTSNIVVGSISLEKPPAHMKDEDKDNQQEQQQQSQQQQQHHLLQNDLTNHHHYASSSQDSIDNVETKLIQIPVCVETRPRVLVHQRSSTASSSPQGSPKNIGLKIIKPKISSVPMVSVSGPSPPIEKPPLAECL